MPSVQSLKSIQWLNEQSAMSHLPCCSTSSIPW